jgi:hypothetical protein
MSLKASVLHGQNSGITLPVKVTSDGKLIISTGASAYPAVSTFALLPDATLHTGEVYLVTTPTGVIWVNKKKAGLYISDGGSATDWRYLGKQKENFNDANFNIFNDSDNTKVVNADLSGITTGNTRTMTYPDRNYSIGNPDYNDYDTGVSQSYKAGRLSFDPTSKTFLADTGFTGVRNNIGQETHFRFFNDTGVTITNGKMINAAGFDATNNVIKGILADSSSQQTSLAVIGMCTADVLDGEVGVATQFGEVRDVNTDAFTAGGVIYLSTSGDLTQTRPTFPDTILFCGTVIKKHISDGIVHIDMARFRRRSSSKSYSFTSTGITAGTYYKGGFYDWATTDANLTQAALTQTYGTVGQAYAAHAGIVPSGAGVVDTGVVGLRVTGIEDDENGTQAAGQIGIITEDITTLTANTYFETSEKFSGQVTYELYVVSGTPVNYSLDFNYGYAKYEDFQNRDVTITELEAVWQGNATDTAFDIALLHHKTTGWTYAATGFLPGNGDICRKSVDQALAGDVVNGSDGAYKRIDLDEFIDGNGSEGVIIEVTTGQNSTIQTMDLHISGVSEEISN